MNLVLLLVIFGAQIQSPALFAVEPLAGLSSPQSVASRSPQESVVKFTAEIGRGQRFEREVEMDLWFRLMPAQFGWIISLGSQRNADRNFAAAVTPPFRGLNHIYVDGWQFRNADNTGPNEAGPSNLNAPGEIREFNFVLNDADYDDAFEALGTMLWSYNFTQQEIDAAKELHDRVKKGKGILTIREITLDNLGAGRQAGIEWMKFDVELTVPSRN